MEMNNKSRLVDSFVSGKILTGPRFSAAAIAKLASDDRYQRLRSRLERVGLFEPAPLITLARGLMIFTLIVVALGVELTGPSWPIRVLSWLLLGFAITQGTFLAHEAAHGAVSKSALAAGAIGHFFDTFFAGYAFTYFIRSHELHHFHCNEIGIDPDVVSTLISVQEESALTKDGFGSSFSRHQHWLIPMCSVVWAHLMRCDSLVYSIRKPRRNWTDLVVLALHLSFYFGVCAYFIGIGPAVVNYMGWSAVVGIYMLLIFPINHVGLPAILPNTDIPFLDQQIVTSRNLSGTSPIWDVLFIGLNLQIEHHLFPWVTSTKLRLARDVVREFCQEEGLPYLMVPYGSALRAIFRRFRQLADLTPRRLVSE